VAQLSQQRLNKLCSVSLALKPSKLQIGTIAGSVLGICAGVCIFLSSGLEIFGFPAMLSHAVAVPTNFTVWLAGLAATRKHA